MGGGVFCLLWVWVWGGHTRWVCTRCHPYRAEEAHPKIPIHRDPQEPLADADEGGRLRNRVGGEVVKLHPVVVAQPPHKAAHRRGEATLVMPDEANDVVVRRVGLPVRRRGTIHAGAPPPRLPPAGRHSRARARRPLPLSTEAMVGGLAPRLAEAGPLRARAEARAAARKGEMSRGRDTRRCAAGKQRREARGSGC
jgi:hypothetical protein